MKPVGQLDRLAELLRDSPHNLVSRRNRAVVRERHVEESWRLGALVRCGEGERWLDLGTGGGLPGLVLALRFPRTQFVLLDSVRKKVEVVERFADELQLENVRTEWARAELFARVEGEREGYDGVISRAVGPLTAVVELSRGFLRPGGRLLAVKGPRAESEVAHLLPLRTMLRVSCPETRQVEWPKRDLRVVSMRAEGAVPAWLPRAPGAARRQPLPPSPPPGSAP